MEIRNSPNKFGQTTFSSVLYGKILVNYIIPFRITHIKGLACLLIKKIKIHISKNYSTMAH